VEENFDRVRLDARRTFPILVIHLYEARRVRSTSRYVSSEISRAKLLTAFAAGSDDLASPPANTASLVAVSTPCFGGQEPVGNLPEPFAD
jgi:hypothetical protein